MMTRKGAKFAEVERDWLVVAKFFEARKGAKDAKEELSLLVFVNHL